jgi:hypothetical protein
MTAAYDWLADRQRTPLGMKVKTPKIKPTFAIFFHLLCPNRRRARCRSPNVL